MYVRIILRSHNSIVPADLVSAGIRLGIRPNRIGLKYVCPLILPKISFLHSYYVYYNLCLTKQVFEDSSAESCLEHFS